MEEGGFVVFYLQLLLFDMNVYVSLAPLKCNCFLVEWPFDRSFGCWRFAYRYCGIVNWGHIVHFFMNFSDQFDPGSQCRNP